jgi:AbrB family looped-hinge helix DNA binding protein
MALMKIIRANQITLPAELRKQFDLSEGDYLDAQATAEGILLKPVSIVERQKAGKALLRLLDRVHAKQSTHAVSPEEQEEQIVQEVKAFRKQKRHA